MLEDILKTAVKVLLTIGLVLVMGGVILALLDTTHKVVSFGIISLLLGMILIALYLIWFLF